MLNLKKWMALSLTAFAFGCSQMPAKPANSNNPVVTIGKNCPAERPAICTLDYTPVCGMTASGATMTYGNACSACGDAKVMSYSAGECRAK